MPKTKVDLSGQISKLLKEYGDDVRQVINGCLFDVIVDTEKYLRDTTPPKHRKGKKPYHQGWTHEDWTNSSTYKGATVYNKNKPQITHLLEFGHVKRGGEGRVDGIPHISKAQDHAEELLIKEVTKGIEQIR